MNSTVSLSLKRFFGMVAVFVLGLTLVACAGPSKKKEQPAEEQATEQKGSLSRTFTIVDGQGRKSGTLTLEFGGGAILRDESGKVIGEFKAISSEAEPSVAQPESEPMETEPEAEPSVAQPSEAQSKPEATETQSEPEKSEVQSEPEAAETQSKPEQSEAQSESETSEPDTEAKE